MRVQTSRELAYQKKRARQQTIDSAAISRLASSRSALNIRNTSHQLMALLLFSTTLYAALPSNKTEETKEAGPDYYGLKTTNVTSNVTHCRQNPLGGTPAKICTVFNSTYYMKASLDARTTLTELANQKLVRDNMEIATPSSEIFYEKDGMSFDKHNLLGAKKTRDFFIASKAMEGFKGADKVDMKDIIEKIGASEVAKLAVANTFIKDLCPQNWGYDKHGLVLIDVDDSPTDTRDHLHIAMLNLESNSRVTLSLSNLKEMRDIYKKMLSKPAPRINDNLRVSKKFYTHLLKSYIQAVEAAIKSIGTQFPELDSSKPDRVINNILVNKIKAQHDALTPKENLRKFR